MLIRCIYSPQGRPCRHYHPRQICRKEGKFYLSPHHDRKDIGKHAHGFHEYGWIWWLKSEQHQGGSI